MQSVKMLFAVFLLSSSFVATVNTNLTPSTASDTGVGWHFTLSSPSLKYTRGRTLFLSVFITKKTCSFLEATKYPRSDTLS